MILWIAIKVACAVVVTMIVIYKLLAYPEHFTVLERIGMGMQGAGISMMIGPIVAKPLVSEGTPFDDWSTVTLFVGLAVYYIGRMARRRWRVGAHG